MFVWISDTNKRGTAHGIPSPTLKISRVRFGEFFRTVRPDINRRQWTRRDLYNNHNNNNILFIVYGRTIFCHVTIEYYKLRSYFRPLCIAARQELFNLRRIDSKDLNIKRKTRKSPFFTSRNKYIILSMPIVDVGFYNAGYFYCISFFLSSDIG